MVYSRLRPWNYYYRTKQWWWIPIIAAFVLVGLVGGCATATQIFHDSRYTGRDALVRFVTLWLVATAVADCVITALLVWKFSMLVRPPKKAPACDSCKSKRVLCYPQPNGPCPRCVDKGILCKTTSIPRGRPRKSPTSSPPAIASSSSISSCRSNVELSRCAILTPELVKHLYQTFADLPERRNRIFHGFSIEKTLNAASWHIHLLPPQEAVLMACMCAAAATISCHPAILGPGVCPESLTDGSVMFPGADLRGFGERRAPICRALAEYAVQVAFEARITLEATHLNVASCFLLDCLEEGMFTNFGPGIANDIMRRYRNQLSIMGICVHLTPTSRRFTMDRRNRDQRHFLGWVDFVFTPADQRFLCGPPAQSLEAVLELIEKRITEQAESNLMTVKAKASLIFDFVYPFLFHATNIARDFHETLCGEYARSHPPSEPAVRKIFANLTTMQSLINHCIGDVDFPDAAAVPQDKNLAELRTEAGTTPELRITVFVMSVVFATFALTLYCELEAWTEPSNGTARLNSNWARTRMTMLRQQAHDLVRSALPDLQRILTLRSVPFYGIAIPWTSIISWGEFLADEGDASLSGVPEADASIYKRLLDALKSVGYSHVSPRLNSVIERLETHLAGYHLKAALINGMMASPQTEMSMFVDPRDDCNLNVMPEVPSFLDGPYFAAGLGY
ncbi:Zn(2)-C6 fungal-type transcriptional factor [Mycena kentingensis (nom. inval.)]|nr:Zn(2)-C6 fungal-type transcriptional factor [Mycena kentingensis (nom. inval.)]